MNTRIHITICPSCGSPNIQYKEGDVTGTYHGQAYVIPSISFYECADCGERVYDREAMRSIERSSPAFQKRTSPKRPVSPKKLSIEQKKNRHEVAVVS